ncbi:DUF3347 domain-containing protein [Pedobacter hiemivivus]|uniref:DUF3347 domain-containing protein n=1 Tax=Pedobacter hiemivivus TaxID=2530454 RepID=A0A4R0MVV8_9SPHI|nr:DUF3347 domain-containing protein [Pedobacter hiemivivus]TCC90957.1 DUF3347 domain-containing protein [Pedobacter hiemivivus]
MRKYLAVMLITGVVSCTNTDQKVAGNSDTTSKAVEIGTAGVELKDTKVQAIYNGYIALKDALVSTKFEDAQKTASVLKTDLANYKGCESTSLIADKIATAKDIKTQRKEFTSLSQDVIALFKHADVVKGSIFVQHCPMANNGDGGDWLSGEQKIQNPYYGDEMMECGRVLEEIKSAK